jgi:hypothetical protein
MKSTESELRDDLTAIKEKLELVLSSLRNKPQKSKYLTAQDVEKEFGIDQRTILNRSNLHPSNKRFIPSLKINGRGRRKYFERKVVDRLLKPNK